VFVSGDVAIARKLIDEKVAVRDAERQAAENHLARLRAGRPESIDSSALHLDILRDLKRIHSHICAVAYPLLDEAGQLYRSRLKRVERRAMQDEETSERRASAAPPDEPAPPPSAGLGRAQDSEAEESELATPPRERTAAR
jgi:phosphate:Na+ symporter